MEMEKINKNKVMKKLLVLLCMGLMLSCSNIQTNPNDYREVNQRCKGKTQFSFEGVLYQILEIDGVEYIAAYHGGLCPLVKIPTKIDTIYIDSVVYKINMDNVKVSKNP